MIRDSDTGITLSAQSGYDDYGVLSEDFYRVTLHVDCRENLAINKYDVDVLVDGRRIATLGHGLRDDYDLELREGSHQVEFRVNGKTIGGNDIYDPQDSGSFVNQSIRVSENETFSYRVKLAMGNRIQVEQLS